LCTPEQFAFLIFSRALSLCLPDFSLCVCSLARKRESMRMMSPLPGGSEDVSDAEAEAALDPLAQSYTFNV
jgi:hypothetical protein